jgi:flavin reductase (DIM6/NTAB) family NADH-FMN oxidoreductase RutF
MGHFATGVTVVASRRRNGVPCGLTANAVTSVSLEPPLVLVCLERGAQSHRCVLEGGAFAISVLSADQRELARRFARKPRDRRFEGVEFREEVTGSPVLEGALAWTDCRVHDVHDAGDHSIVIGEVVASGAGDGEPLIFFRSEYSRVAS